MFSSLKTKLILGVYIFILSSIPVGAYLASKNQNPNTSAKETTKTKAESSPGSGLNDIKNLSAPKTSLEPTSNQDSQKNFGPIMEFILQLEGRPTTKQSGKVFVGIAEGEITNNPVYVLTFSVTTTDSGQYPNLSLAGLTTNARYSAYLKGPAQIATASAFTMSGFTTHLNDSKPLTTSTGDLNDDNVINNLDLVIAKTGDKSADFNLDGFVNAIDFSFITKNINKTGVSGVWTSKPPQP